MNALTKIIFLGILIFAHTNHTAMADSPRTVIQNSVDKFDRAERKLSSNVRKETDTIRRIDKSIDRVEWHIRSAGRVLGSLFK